MEIQLHFKIGGKDWVCKISKFKQPPQELTGANKPRPMSVWRMANAELMPRPVGMGPIGVV